MCLPAVHGHHLGMLASCRLLGPPETQNDEVRVLESDFHTEDDASAGLKTWPSCISRPACRWPICYLLFSHVLGPIKQNLKFGPRKREAQQGFSQAVLQKVKVLTF